MASRRLVLGHRYVALTGALLAMSLVPGVGAGASLVGEQERVVHIVASGTIAVARGMTVKPSKPCPSADHPAEAAAPHRPPEVPAGLVGVGNVDGKAAGLCRYEQAGVLAFPDLALPEGAVLTSARLDLEVASLDAATELQLTASYADAPTGPVERVAELPPALTAPSVVEATGAGPVHLDATAAVEALVTGNGSALLLRGLSGHAFIYGFGSAVAPRLVLTYDEVAEPVEDLVPPTVSVLSPAPGESLFGEVLVKVAASDDVGVEEVTFTVGGQLVGTASAPPYSVLIDTRELFDGEQPLVAEVRDVGGNTARAVIPVVVDNSGGPLHRLDLDLEAGRIDADTYVTQGVRAVLGLEGVSSRYAGELPGEVTVWAWRALQMLPQMSEGARAQVESLMTPVDLDAAAGPAADAGARLLDNGLGALVATTESALTATSTLSTAASVPVSEPGCGRRLWFVVESYDCAIKVGEVTVYWYSADFPAVSGGEVPQRIADAVDGFRNAQDQMEAGLGFLAISKVGAYVGAGGFEGRAISLPNRVIRLNRDDVEITATAGHELVHQYQYRYLDPLDARTRERASDIGWLMEATAEWGSHQIITSRPWDYTDSEVRSYYRNIEAFLNAPTSDLMAWTVSTGRQYGAFPVVEWVQYMGGFDGVRTLWEEVDRTGEVVAALRSAIPSLDSRLPDMWQDLYMLNLRGQGTDQATTDRWRRELVSTLDLPPYETAGGNRPVSQSLRLSQGHSADVPVAVGPGGADLLEVDVAVDQAVMVSVNAVASEGSLGLRVLPLAEYDLDPGTEPQLCVASPGSTFIYDPAECDGLSVVVANTSLTDAAEGLVHIQVGDRVDTTVTNGLVRLGINREGQLNVRGFDASSGTGTTTVGLRYGPTNADALSPGCECEGWGVADIARDLGGSANQSWGGAHGLELVRAGFDTRAGTSVVTAGGGAFRVTHEFYPAAETANLYEVRVTIANTTSWLSMLAGGYYGPLSPTYRRVMDWDVEPTAFSEYVTIGTPDGSMPPEVVNSTNDGFASADPRAWASDLGGRGLFTDLGPADHGALFDIALPEIDPGESVSFTMFYGAAASSAAAKSALGLVGAHIWSLAEPNVANGAQLGEPNTFMFALRFDRALIAARAMEASIVNLPAAPQVARNDGVSRQ